MNGAQLQTKLKTLKLGGMMLTLEVRRAQAEDQRLGHVEFLALLLDDEIDRRQSKMLAQRIHRARFEEQKTLEEFDFGFNPQVPAEQLRNLATCGFVERRESVLLCGPVGVGKTHAAQALGHAACRAGFTVLFTKTAAFLRDLAGGRADGSWEPRLRKYLQTDVLILDDFGMREFTPSQAEDLYELICERYRSGSMIVYVMWNLVAVLSWEEGARGRNPSLWTVWRMGIRRSAGQAARGSSGGRQLRGSPRPWRGCRCRRTWACHHAPSMPMAADSPST